MRRKTELSMTDIEQIKRPGVYATGWRPGLSVRVLSSGSKSFVLRYKYAGTHRMRCLGEVGYVTRELLEKLTDKILGAVEKNIDPLTYFNESKDLEGSLRQLILFENTLPRIMVKEQEAKALLQQAIDLKNAGEYEQSFLVHNNAQTVLSEFKDLMTKIIGDRPIIKVNILDAVSASQEELYAAQKQAMSLRDAFELFLDYERQVQEIRFSRVYKDTAKEGDLKSVEFNKALFYNHIFPITGDILLKDFELMGKVSEMLLQKQADQPALAAKIKALLRKFVSWADSSKLYDGSSFNSTLDKFVSPFTPIDPLASRRHNPCLEVNRVPELINTLWERDKEISRAFIFSILTCSRAQAVRLAKWDEFDLDNKIWHVPLENDKSKTVNHLRTIILSDEACDLLRYQRDLHPNSTFVFVRDDGSALREIAFINEIDSINRYCAKHQLEPYVDKLICDKHGNPRRITQHGTARACFKTWATDGIYGNAKVFNERAVEMCLLHDRKDFYKGAYDRSTFVNERIVIMSAWGKFCCQNLQGGFKRFYIA